MNLTSIQILAIITLLNSFAAGITMYLLSPHIMSLGGNHVVTGALVGGTITCSKLAGHLHASFNHGLKFSIALSLIGSIISYLILSFTASYWMVLLCRFIYGLFNQVENFTKEFIVALTEDFEPSLKLIDVCVVVGTASGAIFGGYVYYITANYYYIAMMATIITFLNFYFLDFVEENPPCAEHEDLAALPQTCKTHLTNLKTIEIKDNWDVFLLKWVYTASFTIFFTKFAMLLKYNFAVGSVVIGYTIAYQIMLNFACRFLIQSLTSSHLQFFHNSFEALLLICSAALVGAYYAPTYECYLIIFVPLITTYTILNKIIDDKLNLRSKENVSKANLTLTTTTEIGIPIFFGVVTQVTGKSAYKLFCMLPTAVCVYLLNKRIINSHQGASPAAIIPQDAIISPPSSDQGSKTEINKQD